MSPTSHFKSQVILRRQWPQLQWSGSDHFLLYDRILDEVLSEDSGFLELRNQFPHRLAVKGGEPLKSFRDFPKNLEILLSKWPQPIHREQTLVVMGGGSLGDFGGFVASILKRGLRLIHIPSTWLAAMDSAHGGKTALNMAQVKNQVGTFYPATKIYIIEDLLKSAGPEVQEQAFGELIKMGLIGDSQFFKDMLMDQRQPLEFMWRYLKPCIEDKYQVILQDPYESKKIRQVLNFGHTMGHVFESHFQWSHGDSVLQGIYFALEWSRYRGELAETSFQQINTFIRERFQRYPAPELKWYKPIGGKALDRLLSQDKKINPQGKILFVFLKSIGHPILKPVLVEDLLSEAKRQGWSR